MKTNQLRHVALAVALGLGLTLAGCVSIPAASVDGASYENAVTQTAGTDVSTKASR